MGDEWDYHRTIQSASDVTDSNDESCLQNGYGIPSRGLSLTRYVAWSERTLRVPWSAGCVCRLSSEVRACLRHETKPGFELMCACTAESIKRKYAGHVGDEAALRCRCQAPSSILDVADNHRNTWRPHSPPPPTVPGHLLRSHRRRANPLLKMAIFAGRFCWHMLRRLHCRREAGDVYVLFVRRLGEKRTTPCLK